MMTLIMSHDSHENKLPALFSPLIPSPSLPLSFSPGDPSTKILPHLSLILQWKAVPIADKGQTGSPSDAIMTVTLYYMPESPPCRAVQMLAAQIGLPLELKHINLDTGEQKSPEFKAINPHQVVPTIVDDGFVLWESRAILKYLVDKYAPNSPLYPTDLKKRAKIDQALDFDIGSLYNSLGKFLVPLLHGKPTDDEGEQKFRSNLSHLENMLVQGYVCGADLTIADISIVAGLSFADTVLFDFSSWDRITKWKQGLRDKIVDYAAINDETMKGFIEYMKDKKSQLANDK